MVSLEASDVGSLIATDKVETKFDVIDCPRTGILGGRDNPMWQYHRKENDDLFYLTPVAVMTTLLISSLVIWYMRMKNSNSKQTNVYGLSKYDIKFFTVLALVIYIVGIHIMFTVPGYNGVTIALVTFFAFTYDFFAAKSNFVNHTAVNFYTVTILISLYVFNAFYCNMFDTKTPSGKFDDNNGIFAIIFSVIFSVALFFRLSYAKPVEGVVLAVKNFDRIIFALISLFFLFQAWGVSSVINLFYLLAFVPLFLALLFCFVRNIFLSKYSADNSNLKWWNMGWLLCVVLATISSFLHVISVENSFHEKNFELRKDFAGNAGKYILTILWAITLFATSLVTYYQS